MTRPNLTDAISQALRRFRHWLSHAAPGDTYTYHVGLLASDRAELVPDRHGVVSYQPVEPFDTLAREVLGAAKEGRVTLWQRRRGPAEYEYLARRSNMR